MKFKTIFDLFCCSHHTSCNIIFCNFKEKEYTKNKRSRIIYSIFLAINLFSWLFFRTDMQAYLEIFYERYTCSVVLDFLTCFEANMLLRNSFSLVLFFSINSLLVVSKNKFSIYFNEKLWILKIFLYLFCFVAAMSMSLYFLFAFAIFSKYLSIGVMILQLVIVHDSILIQLERTILPILKDGCGKIFKIIFGYCVPALLLLTLMVLNFI